MVAWGTIRTFIQLLLSIFVLLFSTYICRGYLDQSGSGFSYSFQKLYVIYLWITRMLGPQKLLSDPTHLTWPTYVCQSSAYAFPRKARQSTLKKWWGHPCITAIRDNWEFWMYVLSYNLICFCWVPATGRKILLSYMSDCESYSLKLLTMNRSDWYIFYWLVDTWNSPQADLSKILG